MGCHQQKNGDNAAKHGKLIGMTILCCGLPLLLLLLLPVVSTAFDLPAGSLQTVVTFLCPALMLLMCFVMMKDHRSAKNNENDDNAECKPIKEGKLS